MALAGWSNGAIVLAFCAFALFGWVCHWIGFV